MGRLQGWLIAFICMVIVVAASYAFVDRPVAFYAHAHLTQYGVFDLLTRISSAEGAVAVMTGQLPGWSSARGHSAPTRGYGARIPALARRERSL